VDSHLGRIDNPGVRAPVAVNIDAAMHQRLSNRRKRR